MDHAEPHELRLAQARDHAEDAPLLGLLHLGLEPDQLRSGWPRGRPGGAAPRRTDAGPVRGSTRPTGLIGPKRERVASAARHLLDGQAALEVDVALEGVQLRALRGDQGVDEGLVLRVVERTVDVVVAALAVARGAERPREVDRVGVHDRAIAS